MTEQTTQIKQKPIGEQIIERLAAARWMNDAGDETAFEDCSSATRNAYLETAKRELDQIGYFDLLSACREWVKYFDDLCRYEDPEDRLAQLRNQFHRSRVEKSRAAVLKAEGK